jgi:hypothetical protein
MKLLTKNNIHVQSVKALFLFFFHCQLNHVHSQGAMFWQQKVVYNPAFSGIENKLDVSSTIQFTQPVDYFSQKLTGFHSNLFFNKRSDQLHGAFGFGGSYRQVSNDGETYLKSFSFTTNYSYHVRFNENSILSIGANFLVGASTRNEENDPTCSTCDFSPDPKKTIGSSFNLGVVFNYKNFEIATALPYVISILAIPGNVTYPYYNEGVSGNLRPFISASYDMNFYKNWSLKPQLVFDLYSSRVSISPILQFKKIVWVNPYYDFYNVFGLNVGATIRNIDFGINSNLNYLRFDKRVNANFASIWLRYSMK